MLEIRDENGELQEVRITAQDFVDAGTLSPGGILLPGHPLFDVSLSQTLPPGWREEGLRKFGNVAQFVRRVDSPLLQPVSDAELNEYLHGGEWDEVEGEAA